MQHGKVNFLIGLSFGSEGKGNIADYLGVTNDLDLSIGNFGPNAGHSVMLNDGSSKVVKMLPVSGLKNENTNILVGSGTILNKEILLKEMDTFNCSNRTLVSAFAPIVNEECKKYEFENLQYIASTFQGTGAALGFKTMRSKNISLVKDDPELSKWCHYHISDIIMNRIDKRGMTALCEIAQGYGLSVDSEFYPYCTSRIVNVGQALAYLDVSPSVVGDVIGIARSYIIRVGNVKEGYSGDTFYDSKEISWEELSDKLGRDTVEFTSVTKRKRRLFTFSKKLFEMAVKRNGVNVLFMTFVDYLNNDEKSEMIDYLTSDKFDFKEIYFVSGFGNYDKYIEKIK